MNPPWVYTSYQSWIPLPPPTPYNLSGSSPCIHIYNMLSHTHRNYTESRRKLRVSNRNNYSSHQKYIPPQEDFISIPQSHICKFQWHYYFLTSLINVSQISLKILNYFFWRPNIFFCSFESNFLSALHMLSLGYNLFFSACDQYLFIGNNLIDLLILIYKLLISYHFLHCFNFIRKKKAYSYTGKKKLNK